MKTLYTYLVIALSTSMLVNIPTTGASGSVPSISKSIERKVYVKVPDTLVTVYAESDAKSTSDYPKELRKVQISYDSTKLEVPQTILSEASMPQLESIGVSYFGCITLTMEGDGQSNNSDCDRPHPALNISIRYGEPYMNNTAEPEWPLLTISIMDGEIVGYGTSQFNGTERTEVEYDWIDGRAVRVDE